MRALTMNFKKLKLDRIIWQEGSHVSNKYFQNYFGYYFLDKTKRTRKTINSFNCWIKKKGGSENDCLHLTIKTKRDYFEVKIANKSGKFYVGFPAILYIEKSQKSKNQMYNHNGLYLFTPYSHGANSIYIHFLTIKGIKK